MKGARRIGAPQWPAMGLETELELWLNGKKVRPEDVFATPASFIRGKLVHRTGKSYHLPSGGAVYFDTGVIEVATPIVEIDRGCAARATRLLWEGIDHVRRELTAWERKSRKLARLVGFSTHVSVSFDVPPGERRRGRTVEDLAWALVHLLPAPVMLLGTNRASTGVGVRPRGDRIEITADFTPDPERMVASASAIVGIVRAVTAWPAYTLSALKAAGLPMIRGFAPMPHTSRKGWLARWDRYPQHPWEAGPDAAVWAVGGRQKASLREVATRIVRHFENDIRAVAPPPAWRHIRDVLSGKRESLMDLDARPASYEDVGRKNGWRDLYTEKALPRSRYERVLLNALAGRPLVKDGQTLTPVGVKGWLHVDFQTPGGKRRRHHLDELVDDLRRWK